MAVLGHGQRRLDESREDRAQLTGPVGQGALQLRQAQRGHVVHAPAEHLVDQVFLGPEVVIDRGDIDVGAAGDLAQ